MNDYIQYWHLVDPKKRSIDLSLTERIGAGIFAKNFGNKVKTTEQTIGYLIENRLILDGLHVHYAFQALECLNLLSSMPTEIKPVNVRQYLARKMGIKGFKLERIEEQGILKGYKRVYTDMDPTPKHMRAP